MKFTTADRAMFVSFYRQDNLVLPAHHRLLMSSKKATDLNPCATGHVMLLREPLIARAERTQQVFALQKCHAAATIHLVPGGGLAAVPGSTEIAAKQCRWLLGAKPEAGRLNEE